MAEMTPEQTNTETVLENNVSFEDYLARYDGQRAEWHAGKVIQRMSNNPQHNFIVGFLYKLLDFFLTEKGLGQIILDGVAMYISEEVPAREPDLMVLLGGNVNNLDDKALRGAADICIEVISQSTGHIDRGAKFAEYEAAGVKEYWMIDPIRENVDVYALSEEGYYRRYEPNFEQLTSKLLAQFVLDKSILWQDNLPAGRQIGTLIDTMLKAD